MGTYSVTTKRQLYVFLLVFQCTIFGFGFIVVKKLLNYGIPTFLLLAIRFFIGGFSLFIAGLVFGKKTGKGVSFSKKEVVYGIIAGLALFVSFGLQTVGANYTTPAKSGLLTGVFVVSVPLISMIIKRKLLVKPIILSIICFIGIIIVSGISIQEMKINSGDVLSFLCGIGFAVHFLLLEKFAQHEETDAIWLTVMQLITVSCLSVVLSLLWEKDIYGQVQWVSCIGWLLFAGIIGTSVTYLIQTVVQAKLSAVTVSVISCMEPVFAVIISLILGYEIFSFWLMIGGMIILASMVTAAVQPQDG